MKKHLAVLALPILLAACSNSDNAAEITSTDLQHHNWVLAKVDGKAISLPAEAKVPSIEVGEKMSANGFAGCNTYFGQAELKDGKFRVDGMGMTMMMCSDTAMQTEQVVAGTLSEWSDITLTKESLILKGAEHELTFTLRDWVN